MTMMDNQKEEGSHSLIFPGTTNIAAGETFMASYAATLGLVSSCTLMQYQLLTQFVNDVAFNAVSADVEEPGVFVLITDGGVSFIGETPSIFSIPAIAVDKLSPGTNNINTADADVAALVTALLSGIDDVRPCDYRGVFFGDLDDARREGRRSHLKRS